MNYQLRNFSRIARRYFSVSDDMNQAKRFAYNFVHYFRKPFQERFDIGVEIYDKETVKFCSQGKKPGFMFVDKSDPYAVKNLHMDTDDIYGCFCPTYGRTDMDWDDDTGSAEYWSEEQSFTDALITMIVRTILKLQAYQGVEEPTDQSVLFDEIEDILLRRFPTEEQLENAIMNTTPSDYDEAPEE